ncbi:MAG TPA: hypothetical protein VHZ25_05485 [Acidobacteriaceae bacterium]|nr:hypothetical protein [Acidobacteriaceae bacterium]
MTAVGIVLVSGCVAGVLDIAATGLVMRAQGMSFRRLLQFVASGVLGSAAFEGGSRTAAMGLTLHFLIAWFWALIYGAAADLWPVLLLHPVMCGALFGVVVHLAMSQGVVRLSRAARRPFAWKAWLTQLAIHMVCVGWPVALIESLGSR